MTELATKKAGAARTGAAHRMLRSPLSVVGATLASFLVVLALLTAKVTSGHEQALPAGGAGSALVVKNGHKVLRTTASGRVLEPASNVAGVQASNTQAGAQPAALVTHTSGAVNGGGQDD
ncbi:MAG TPA: hypothetical protein VLJ80_14125 [Solirubrobacteraceae bacterium]|nr:hypothetical protein [Solirubrobacteraceae bacterium]